jgi:hypothetical protein
MRHPAREALDLLLEPVDPFGLLTEASLQNEEHDRGEADREKDYHLALFRGEGGLTPGLLETTNRRDEGSPNEELHTV